MQNKIKREVDLKHGRLISVDLAQLFVEAVWVDGSQAKIVLILQMVTVTETRADLCPVLPACVCDVFFCGSNKARRNKNWIRFPTTPNWRNGLFGSFHSRRV